MTNAVFTIKTTVNYGDRDYPVRLEREGSDLRGWTFAGYVSKELSHIGTSLVQDAVAEYTGVTAEELRRECSSWSFRNDEFCHVVFCRRGEKPAECNCGMRDNFGTHYVTCVTQRGSAR